MTLILLLNMAATWAMFGLIWFVQLVHYPLFGQVGDGAFAGYQVEHMRRTTWIVAPIMIVEGITALGLVLRHPIGIYTPTLWLGILLLVLIWVSTALLQVSRHQSLLDGFDRTAHRSLVRSNWIRTIAWTIRSALALYWTVAVLPL